MDKVLFIDIFGMEHIPKRRFKDLDDAQQYANDHELRVVRKLKEEVKK
jgi:hypothetical protein